MPYGCNGGFEVRDSEISVTGSGSWSEDYTKYTLEISDGRLLYQSQGSLKLKEIPKDTVTEISNGTLIPLRDASVRSLTPSGFDAVVVTGKFIFAKQTYFGSDDLPNLTWYARVVVVDRLSRSVVWETNGKGMTIQASPDRIIVCDADSTTVFIPEAVRPQEVTDFYSAIRHGDTQKVMRLLPAWKRTPLYDLGGATPLTLGAQEGKTGVVKQLLAGGLSPNTHSADGNSPLMTALSRKEHHDIALLLLQSGADVNDSAGQVWPPLLEASEYGSQQLISLLLQKGVNVNTRDNWNGGTALHIAVRQRNYDAIEALLKGGVDRNIKDNNGETALENEPTDECIKHMFTDGRVSTLPPSCTEKPSLSDAVGFSPMQLIH